MTSLQGAHAVVTGGSSGIGLATGRELAQRGARVSLVARGVDALEAARGEIITAVPGATVGTVSCDVRDRAAVAAAFAALADERGPCDVLLTAAGSATPGYFTELDDAVFREQMDLDYFGTLHAVRAVVPSMVERGRGHLVFVASTAALIGVFGYSAYAPAKYAVRGLSDTLQAELGPRGIVVACAYPPDTDTPGLARENATKPPETARISAAIKVRDATSVAVAIVRGIEHDRLVITADVQTAALAHAGAIVGPFARWSMGRAVRKAQRETGTFEQ
jgi:3-dehydrosphinganine reductase